MLVGPVFSREAVTLPRRRRFFIARITYAGMLLVLACTAWLVVTGTSVVRGVDDLARFGAILFQLLAPLQLALAVFFSALAAAGAVAQEKDRRTLVLLLLTQLNNSELVLGKWLASLLSVLALLAAALPVYALLLALGGVSWAQLGWSFAVTLASALAAGSLGSTVALWREKTFQTLALVTLALAAWLVGWEVVRAGVLGESFYGVASATWAAAFSPWQAVLAAVRPDGHLGPPIGPFPGPLTLFVAFSLAVTVCLSAVAILRVRVWNPSREARPATDETWTGGSLWETITGRIEAEPAAATEASATGVALSIGDIVRKRRERAPAATLPAPPLRLHRQVWDNPILWREVRTWAYGRKIIVVQLAYLSLAVLAAAALVSMVGSPGGLTRAQASLALVPLFVLSLVLINAQAVTALTGERDGRAIDLLLVSDLSPAEFIFGKLGGIFYNVKEVVLAPLLLCGYLWWVGELSGENLIYVCGGLLVMDLFVAVLGLHVGMIYESSRTAIFTSLGTVFFLFVGIAVCMRLMVAFSGSFEVQLQPFLAFMVGGGVGLYLALGARNPSPAIALASALCPFATFYAITSFLLEYTLGVFLVTGLTYGFATAAMLVPALYEFDVATGRTTADE
ncbi:MAG: ABC transporter permease [Pirellulales bacterium]|nr:ABC transporter permease [Pirellulales bacterium]